ncbi:hypothetical protein J2T56_000427 [Natronobacillus azotifigens]
MTQEQKKTHFKGMQWFGFFVVILSLVVDTSIVRPKNGPGPILGFSYLTSLGILIGTILTFIYIYKEKKMKN